MAPPGLPRGPGVEDVYVICGACHSVKLVKQQRMNRDNWADTLEYMVEEQAMEQLDAEDLKLVLDYLAKFLGQEVPR